MTAAATAGTHKVASTKEERKVGVPCSGHVNEGCRGAASRTQKGDNAFPHVRKMLSLNLTRAGVFLLPFYALSLF